MNGRRICVWSGPRNISTALMYAFRQRPDTTVVDEPLYAYYLAWSGAAHPGADAVLAAQSQDPDEVWDRVILGDYPTRHVFFKQMAHHLQDCDLDRIGRVDNVLLTRHPAGVLRSLSAKLGEVSVADTGLPRQVQLLEQVVAAGGEPLVLLSEDLLAHPPGVLATLCGALGMAFDPAMLHWPEGPKPEDGVWARYWYHNVHRSTGFGPPRPAAGPLHALLAPVLEQCLPLYETLAEHALRPI